MSEEHPTETGEDWRDRSRSRSAERSRRRANAILLLMAAATILAALAAFAVPMLLTR
jgi:type IV secretory pathway component VirB8